MPTLTLCACGVVMILAVSCTSPQGPVQAAPNPAQEARLKALALADAELATHPNSEAAIIWVGRRQAYLGRFREAIETYTRGIALHPESWRLLRHRGHRWITLRDFESAAHDLAAAWRLAKDAPDVIEPDGIPTPGVSPRSTDHGNILYHLGLTHYLRGEFPYAAGVFGIAVARATNDDSLVSASYWRYLALRRAGSDAKASEVLRRIVSEADGGMDVRENKTYWKLLLLYKGALQLDALVPQDSPLGLGVDQATLGYGISMHALLAGDMTRAQEIWRNTIGSTDRPAFGHIACEAELSRATK